MSAPVIDGIDERPVSECTAARVADAITTAFEGYVTPLKASPRWYERRFRSENLDPFASRLYFGDAGTIAVLLIARRGWTSRIAAMTVAPEARGRGFGKEIMRRAIDEAVSRGDRSVLLEVYEANTPAVNLYTGLGLRPLRRLVGYRREPGEPSTDDADKLSEMDPLELARAMAREGEPDLPWMLAAETLSTAASPARAYHVDHHAYALIGDPAAESIGFNAILVPRTERRKGWGTRLLRALDAAFPNRAWSVPAIVPEDLAPDFFARCGWELEEMSQLEIVMHLQLADRKEAEDGTTG